MSDKRTRFLTCFVGVLLFACATPAGGRAQEKDKEAQKPTSGTVDAWRQALPPEAETSEPSEGEAAAAQPRVSREEVEAGLLALERKWMEALRLRDASGLSQIIADDFALVSPQLVVATGDKEKYFKHAMGELNLASYEFEELSVRLYGRAAVVSGRLKQSANVAGADWGGSYLVTDVWVSRDGFWRVVSRHATLLPVKK
jgi:ketosteroid isomerase-like protein